MTKDTALRLLRRLLSLVAYRWSDCMICLSGSGTTNLRIQCSIEWYWTSLYHSDLIGA
jgi:hypothetical protein